jgi:aconitate hydratase
MLGYFASKLLTKARLMSNSLNTFDTKQTLSVNGKNYTFFNIKAAEISGKLPNVSKLPFSLKILLENCLRKEDGNVVKAQDIKAFSQWLDKKSSTQEIAFHPARVLMQDFTGVPAVVDLAAMRDALVKLGGNPEKINPLCPVDLVIDHSVQIDSFGKPDSLRINTDMEIERNVERYAFLKWGQQSFKQFQAVPPGTGICHQVNLEYLGHVVCSEQKNGEWFAYHDTLVGTDSHTTMINGIGVLGWGVGGIEAEAAMLGQPVSMLIPEVVGFELKGALQEGVTATDLVLKIVQMLRQHGVVEKLVEFYGPGLAKLSLADRATIANMAPEYGATCGLFPIDQVTLDYMRLSGRSEETIALTEAYTKATGTFHTADSKPAQYSSTLSLDLSSVVPSVAGPKRPQDHVALTSLKKTTEETIIAAGQADTIDRHFDTDADYKMHQGDVVIAAITSCTNTSNPAVMLAAGLVAKKAYDLGLSVKPWVKTSLAPGSKVVTDYLVKTGLLPYLEKMGFAVAGYGCTTCIGNSGPLPDAVEKCVAKNNLIAGAVLSGNRNFEGRIHPLVKASWLASPPLVVAFALAGTTRIDMTKEAVATNNKGESIYLKDIWPSNEEIAALQSKVTREMFKTQYANVFEGDDHWKNIPTENTKTYQWQPDSTYVRNPPYFEGMQATASTPANVKKARILAILSDSVTTDHISPAGSIKPNSPAGEYLIAHGVAPHDFNSYGSRRGNHEVMMRGTFANIRIRNHMVLGIEGGITKNHLNGKVESIYDAAMAYKKENTPLVIFAGKEYGTGSSRDWAAKGTVLLGVKAVIAQSFERIHRSNLVGMGVLPLEFLEGTSWQTLGLTGEETIDILGIDAGITPGMTLTLRITGKDGKSQDIPVLCRIDTDKEVEYYNNQGILQYVIRQLLNH